MSRTLQITYTTTTTYRAILGSGTGTDMARAIEECMSRTGLLRGLTGIDPESIRFTVEDE